LKQRLDANHDGKIDPQERAAAVENFKANHPRPYAALLKKFDTNGDGKIDEQDRAAAREAIKARIQQRRAEAGQK